MAAVGRWLVPVFLLLLGALLIFDGNALNANANANLVYERQVEQSACTNAPGGPTPCETLSACQSECGLAELTGVLGWSTVLAGMVVGAVRTGWVRPFRRARRARAPESSDR